MAGLVPAIMVMIVGHSVFERSGTGSREENASIKNLEPTFNSIETGML
jgi:hypothetical protein